MLRIATTQTGVRVPRQLLTSAEPALPVLISATDVILEVRAAVSHVQERTVTPPRRVPV